MKVEKVDIKELWFTEQLLYWNDIKDNKIKELEKKLKNKSNFFWLDWNAFCWWMFRWWFIVMIICLYLFTIKRQEIAEHFPKVVDKESCIEYFKNNIK